MHVIISIRGVYFTFVTQIMYKEGHFKTAVQKIAQ